MVSLYVEKCDIVIYKGGVIMSKKQPLKPEGHKPSGHKNSQGTTPKPHIEYGEKRNGSNFERHNPEFRPKGGSK